ncbi:MAG: hypothetical protein JWP97_1606 [Labilithrix sp.]|nr:hypothetical protein [Labilithrix sp.]
MKDALAQALCAPSTNEDTSADRILAASFFRSRPLQAGSPATVIRLEDRRSKVSVSSL